MLASFLEFHGYSCRDRRSTLRSLLVHIHDEIGICRVVFHRAIRIRWLRRCAAGHRGNAGEQSPIRIDARGGFEASHRAPHTIPPDLPQLRRCPIQQYAVAAHCRTQTGNGIGGGVRSVGVLFTAASSDAISATTHTISTASDSIATAAHAVATATDSVTSATI